jgi:4-diphosphocytidyl-2-C-methyl-D-erythritol kinase
MRHVSVRAFAKLNLDLRVLNQGPGGFHELRSVFQTISLHDRIDISYAPSKKTKIEGTSAIPNNLVERAARALLDHTRETASLAFRLDKRIPMGSGMGGGSSDAAAVLLALPVLAGMRIPLGELIQIAAGLGSDVPFFLLGGAAVALGRGTELYPLPEIPSKKLLIVAPGVHVSTPDAYRAFNRAGEGKLTETQVSQYIDSFQSRVWGLGKSLSKGSTGSEAVNDFERVVFPQHRQLKSILTALQKSGADPARMTGSGSALFGVFTTQQQVLEARAAVERSCPQAAGMPATFVSRARYKAYWWRQLQPHMDSTDPKSWPPQSRYASRRRNER